MATAHDPHKAQPLAGQAHPAQHAHPVSQAHVVQQHGPAGTHVKQYDNLKTLLKNAKSTSGQDLYAHL